MLQVTMFVPESPGMGALQETESLLLDPVITDEVICMRLSITIAKTRLLARSPVEFCKVHLSVPVRLPTRSLGMGLAESEMETTGVPAGGFPCTVVRATGAIENAEPVPSMPVAEEESVIAALNICVTTSTVMDAPGSRLPSEQLSELIPCPPGSQVPWLG